MEVDDNDRLEREHWINVMRTFLHYEEFVMCELDRRQRHLNRLPAALAAKLPDITFSKLGSIQNASQVNQDFFNEMVYFHASHTSFDENGKVVIPTKEGSFIHIAQQHRNNAVLHSLYREWSAEGAAERAVPFDTIINELKTLLPVTSENAYRQRVLVPGCGVGRLPVEIASHGYSVEGNEFSAFMAIASNFVLNGLQKADEFDIHPWLETLCNIVEVKDTLCSVVIPDVAAVDIIDSFAVKYPHLLPPHSTSGSSGSSGSSSSSERGSHFFTDLPFPKFSMATGDFVEIYGKDPQSEGQWDCVVTCFFIDTAPVVIDYIECIHRILRPGGVWINFGPLLYHWVADQESNQDERYDQSVELSYEEVKYLLEQYKFEFIREAFHECCYSRNVKSMMYTVYNAVMFSVRKPLV